MLGGARMSRWLLLVLCAGCVDGSSPPPRTAATVDAAPRSVAAPEWIVELDGASSYPSAACEVERALDARGLTGDCKLLVGDFDGYAEATGPRVTIVAGDVRVEGLLSCSASDPGMSSTEVAAFVEPRGIVLYAGPTDGSPSPVLDDALIAQLQRWHAESPPRGGALLMMAEDSIGAGTFFAAPTRLLEVWPFVAIQVHFDGDTFCR